MVRTLIGQNTDYIKMYKKIDYIEKLYRDVLIYTVIYLDIYYKIKVKGIAKLLN